MRDPTEQLGERGKVTGAHSGPRRAGQEIRNLNLNPHNLASEFNAKLSADLTI